MVLVPQQGWSSHKRVERGVGVVEVVVVDEEHDLLFHLDGELSQQSVEDDDVIVSWHHHCAVVDPCASKADRRVGDGVLGVSVHPG